MLRCPSYLLVGFCCFSELLFSLYCRFLCFFNFHFIVAILCRRLVLESPNWAENGRLPSLCLYKNRSQPTLCNQVKYICFHFSDSETGISLIWLLFVLFLVLDLELLEKPMLANFLKLNWTHCQENHLMFCIVEIVERLTA